MNKSKLFASIKRGFTFAGYSKSIVDAIKQMKDIK